MRILLLPIFLLLTTVSFAQVDKSNHSLLWEITGNQLTKKSYLFGTMHVQDERAHEFTDSTLVCLDQTEVYAMEVNFDSIMGDMVGAMLEVDTANVLRQQLSAKAYDRLNQEVIKKLGMPIDSLPNKNPFFIEMSLTSFVEPASTVKKAQFVDLYLMKRAAEQGHPTYGLEKLSDYGGVMDSFYEQFEDDSYQSEFDYNVDSLYEVMMTYYRSGDIEAMYTGIVDEWEDSDYGNEMLNVRNVNMLLELEKLMKTKSVFCAVGTAHLPGKNGMIEALREKGYNLRRVTPSFEGYAKDYERTVVKEWGTYTDSSHYFSVQIPGEKISLDEQVESMGEGATASMFMDMMDMQLYMQMTFKLGPDAQTKSLDTLYAGVINRFSTGGGEELLESRDITRSGIAGKQIMTQKDEDIKVWEVFIRGKLIHLFAVYREGGDIVEKEKDRYFDSLTFLESDWKNYNNVIGAYSVDLQMEPSTRRVVQDKSYEEDPDRQVVIFTDLCVNNITGMNFLIRYSDTEPGLVVNDIKKAIFGTIDVFNGRFGTPITEPKPTIIDGLDGYTVKYELSTSFFDMSVVRRGCREYVIGVEYPKEGFIEEDAERFLSSIKFQPYQLTDFNLGGLEGTTYTIGFPGKVEHFKKEYRGYPIMKIDEYFSSDTTFGGYYEMDVYHYNDFYSPTEEDLYFVDFQRSNKESNKEGEVTRDTMFQGYEASYSIKKSKGSETRVVELLFHNDLYLYRLMAVLPDEVGNEKAWSFFNSFKNKSKGRKDYLKEDKKALLLKALENTTDSLEMKTARYAMKYMDFSKSDLPAIYEMLEKDLPGNVTDENSAAAILLREFSYTSDETTVPFLEKLFKEKKGDRAFQKEILTAFTALRTRDSYDAFFTQVKDYPRDTALTLEYANMFNGLKDSLMLTGDYLPALFELTPDITFRRYVYSVLAYGVNNDTVFDQKLKPYLPVLLKDANRMVSENKLLEARDSFPDMEEYIHINALNFVFTFIKDSAVGNYFNTIKDIPSPRLLVNIVDGMLFNGLEVPESTYEKVAASPYSWKRLLNNLKIGNNVDKVPDRLHTQERMVEAIVANSIEDEYDEVVGYKLLEVIDRQFKGEDYKVYIYHFSVRGYGEEKYLGICSQPLNGVEIEDNYFYYFTSAYSEENKKEILKKLMDAWED